MTNLRTIRVSIHGHSPVSDGLSSIPELVAAAGKAKIDFFGISDHSSVEGVVDLYKEVASFNKQNQHQIQAVSACEIYFPQVGDILFFKPGPLDKKFLDWCRKVISKIDSYDVIEAVKEAIAKHGAFILFVHPELPWTGAVSFESIRKICRSVDPEVPSHLCLEIHNWSANVVWGINWVREWQVARLNKELELAAFGSTDYHAAWEISKRYTEYKAKDTSVKGFIEAIEKREMRPSSATWIDPFTFFLLGLVTYQALQEYNKKYAPKH